MALRPGAGNSITDVAGLRVGNAGDDTVKTGVTVLVGERPFVASVDVMGGAPGTRDTELLRPDRSVETVDALVLSGGSVFGLEASSAVTEALHRDGRGTTVGGMRVPIAPAAIIFDLINGGDKDWAENPYPSLGRAAYRSASAEFALGTQGAGVGATTANLKGGLGTASLVLESGATVGTLAVVNPTGRVVVGQGPHFWAAPFEWGAEFGGKGAAPAPTDLAATFEAKEDVFAKLGIGSTVLAIVATDAPLSKAECKRVAVAAQDGIARAVMPAHTPLDGDLVFALSTAVPGGGAGGIRDVLDIGHAAALCVARAIARGVYEARAEPGDVLPTWQSRFAE